MSDVKWIKITTDIFDDEKILLIESLPEADSIIVIWFKLLCLAGKMNNSGVFVMNNRIPYTDQMLATIFRRKETTIKLALETFEKFGMIEIVNGVITIPNWDKHQSLDAYERKKKRDREYQAERRAKQRSIADKSYDKSSDKSSDSHTTQSSYVAPLEEDIDKDKDIYMSVCPDPEPIECFESFWNNYPKKVHRSLAEQEYVNLVLDNVKEEWLVKAAKEYAMCKNGTNERYIKNPENWLKEKLYLDYPPGTYERQKKQREENRESSEKPQQKKNQFNNFPQRKYSKEESLSLEQQLLRQSRERSGTS